MEQPQPEDPTKAGDPKIQLEPCTSEQLINNPFTEENCDSQISLSVYNGPQQIVAKKPRPITTQDALLRRIPGWKPPKKKEETGDDGEPIPQVAATEYTRESVLPAFSDLGDLLSKDAIDQYR